MRIGRALVGVVAALLPTEINGRIAGIFILGGFHFRGIRAVLADEAFQAGPRFDQRPVRSEVFIADPAFLAREVRCTTPSRNQSR